MVINMGLKKMGENMGKLHYILKEFQPIRYYQKFIKPLITFGDKGYVNRYEISLNNTCNLKCYSCSSLCDKPIGSNVFRDKIKFQSLEGIKRFLSSLKDYRKNYWVRLVGGEPTIPNNLEFDYLEKISELCKKYNYKLDILTNGFRIMDYNPFIFDYIHLDYHGGINAEHIDTAIKYFNDVGYKNYNVQPTLKHFDIQKKIGYPTSGIKCPEFMKSITLWKNVVYPCCISPYLGGWWNTKELDESLVKHGWNVYSDKLDLIIDNWEYSLPDVFYKFCNIRCWRNNKKVEWVDIDENS